MTETNDSKSSIVNKILAPVVEKLDNILRSTRYHCIPLPANCRIGTPHNGEPDIIIHDKNTKLSIGKYCSFAEGTTFLVGGEHSIDCVTTFNFVYSPRSKGDIVIGNDVWFGSKSLVLSGVKIGDGAVVAAGAVVTNEVPPYAIGGGVPARVIRYRFSPEKIRFLLELKWWDWSEDKVKAKLGWLKSSLEPFVVRNNVRLSRKETEEKPQLEFLIS